MTDFPAVRIEGGLFGPDLLERLLAGELPGQHPTAFGLSGRQGLTDEIAAAFADARAHWEAFRRQLDRLPEGDMATSATRDAWALPFFSLLGYELRYNPRAYDLDGVSFAISHRAGDPDDAPPVHIVGARQPMGRVAVGGRPRLSPHALMQEFLNRTEHLWGIVTNGETLRLLRNSAAIRRQAYVEFDLRQIFEEQRFQEFAALYRLLHRTRLPQTVADARDCLLERYYQDGLTQGDRVRERLRDGVEQAIQRLANGFLAHPANANLRDRLMGGATDGRPLTPHALYQQLLRLVYRFLFLLVSEERGLISPNRLYREDYSISRLRRYLDRRRGEDDADDLWRSLQALWIILSDQDMANMLGAAPLNGQLFESLDLDTCAIANRDLLDAFWHLAYYQDAPSSAPRRVNYAALDVEELGSVYESLLDYHPQIVADGAALRFELAAGSERKATGSYYTPPELVNALIRSALEPVIAERLQWAKQMSSAGGERGEGGMVRSEFGAQPQRETGESTARRSPSHSPSAASHSPNYAHFAEHALLSIRVLDPACGSGHFLLAAARRLGKELARIRTGEDEPAPEQVRLAIRDVVAHCIYGVDKNPLAVELARVALWLESHAEGKPLTFLDHRIQCGDSLVGLTDLAVLEDGIPDEAFAPVSDDDKQIAGGLKRQNRAEAQGQTTLFSAFDA
ncbi:MAG: DNA methyltransferase, partial [Thermoflexales bacterium]